MSNTYFRKFYSIQVKQKDKAMMMRENCQKRFFVSFDYTGDARTEISRFFKQSGRIIVPQTVQEIRDEEIAHKLV